MRPEELMMMVRLFPEASREVMMLGELAGWRKRVFWRAWAMRSGVLEREDRLEWQERCDLEDDFDFDDLVEQEPRRERWVPDMGD
jgi:hypothetical protein